MPIITPVGGNGGDSSVLVASLTLDDAGIQALAATPAVLVPATTIINYDPVIVPDVVFVPISGTVITSIVTGYALGGGTPSMLLAYSSDFANNATAKAGISTSLGTPGTWQTDLPCPPTFAPEAGPISIVGVGGQPINGDWLDNALVLALSDATPTGGDPANTLTVRVLYHIVPTA